MVSYNINGLPFPDQSVQVSDVSSNVFYINNTPSPISDLGPLPRASMFTVPKQLSAKPKRPRKQSKSRISLPELFIRMGLADNHEVARKREQRV